MLKRYFNEGLSFIALAMFNITVEGCLHFEVRYEKVINLRSDLQHFTIRDFTTMMFASLKIKLKEKHYSAL